MRLRYVRRQGQQIGKRRLFLRSSRFVHAFRVFRIKATQELVCVAGGARSKTFTFVFFSCTRRDSVNECRPALVAQYTGEMGNGTNPQSR